MTTTTGSMHARRLADREPTSHVLLRDDRGRLTLMRLWPWHRVLARCAAARLDGELAAGVSPESSAVLAARAAQLTSMKVRCGLASPLATLANCLAAPGPVPAQAVAMVSQLLTDGTGPLYRQASRDDLGGVIENVTRTLAR